MRLGSVIPLANRIRVNTNRNMPSAINTLETSKGVFYYIQDSYSEKDYEFYVLLINLFDRAIIEDNLSTLSIEQEDLLNLYFKEANVITPNSDVNLDNYVYDFSKLSKHIDKLDEFLGSFLGVEDGRFARYGTKQFYRQRQPFSTTIENIGGA